MQEIAELSYPVMSSAQEGRLFRRLRECEHRLSRTTPRWRRRWQREIDNIKETIIRSNFGMILKIQKNFPDISPDEAISDGSMALLRAIDRFDVEKGYRFSTYAWTSIKNAFRDVYKSEKRFSNMEKTGILDEVITTLCPTIVPDDQSLAIDVAQFLEHNAAGLTAMEIVIVRRYYGLSDMRTETFVSLGRELGMSRERIRQIHNEAVGKLRDSWSGTHLEEIFGDA